MKNLNKIGIIVLTFFVLFSTFVPPKPAKGATESGSTPAAWPEVFSPYTLANGTPVLDPASDVHPVDVDITSGVDRGTGVLPSMYVASDGTNFFVRLRVKGNPYDRKGGFLSSVWLVKLAVNGEAKATIGLNGKSPHIDYVYVANESGTDVHKVYQTSTDGGSEVAGTRITPAENGQYFLDFQVPISKVTEVASDITATQPVQFFFGTSKAANLSVINKDWMNANGTEDNVSFSGLKELSLNEQPLTVSIDGGNSKTYSTANHTVTGKSSLETGTVSLKINNDPAVSVNINQHSWNYELPPTITGINGTYQAVAAVTDNNKTETAKQDIVILDNSNTLVINGSSFAMTNSKTPVLSGTYAGTNKNNVRIKVYIDGVMQTDNAPRDTNILTWNYQETLPAPVDGKTYTVKVDWTGTANNASTFATTTQQLTYKEGSSASPVEVAITGATGAANPAITGSSSGADKVELRIDGKTVEFATPNKDGSWSIPALEKPLTAGNHTITAIASNASGNTAAANKDYTVNTTAISIDNGTSVTTNDNKPTIRGNTNATVGSVVTVVIDGKDIYTDTIESNSRGSWAIEVPDIKPLNDGTHVITASVNGASASQQLVVDTGTSVTIKAPADGSTSSEKKPTFSGTSEMNASVELRVIDENQKVVHITNINAVPSSTTIGSTWEWLNTMSTELSVGTYTIQATAADPFGNEDTDTHTFTIVPDTSSLANVDDVRKSVQNGTSLEDAKKALGMSVAVVLEDGKTKDIPVSWSTQSTPDYDGTKAGIYVFTGTFGTLPAGVDNDAEVSAPTGIVTVQLPPTVSLKHVDNVSKTVPNGTAKEDAIAALGTSVEVELENGKKVQIPITWSSESTPSYDGSHVGTYQFTGTFGTLPAGIDNADEVATPTGSVTVLEPVSVQEPAPDQDPAPNQEPVPVQEPQTVKIAKVSDLTKTVALGTSKTAALAALGTTVRVELENSDKIDVPVTWSEQSSPSYNGNQAGAYVFTGSFGELPAGINNDGNVSPPKGTVQILSDSADIESYQIPEETKSAEIDQTNRTIHVEVKYGTELEGLIAAFTLSGRAQGVKIGEVSQVSGQTANDFTHSLLYIVKAEDGTEKEWTVYVTAQEKTTAPVVKGTIRSGDRQVNGTSEPGAEILVKQNGDELGKVSANELGNWTLELSANQSLSEGEQLSLNATSPGKLVSDVKEVVVERAFSSEKQILSTTLGELTEDNSLKEVPAGTKVSELIAGLVISPKAKLEVVGPSGEMIEKTAATEIDSNLMIRVTAEDGTTSDHTISIHYPVDLVLTADPTRIIGDGTSTAILKAVLKDRNGNPISNTEVHFEAEAGTLSQTTSKTNEQGEAIVELTAPKIEGTVAVTKKVSASVSDPDKGISAKDEITIAFEPPIIVGQVLDESGKPIADTKVWIVVNGEKIEATTDSDGNYQITVPTGGDYTVNIEVTSLVGNEKVTSVYTQEAHVQASGQSEKFKSERKVSGQLFIQTRNDKLKSIQAMFPDADLDMQVLNDPSGAIKAQIDDQGHYELTGFEANKTYQVVFNVVVNGQRLAGKFSEITVGSDGQLVVQHELIDPFGLVTDSVTGELIEGVNMKIYWADTDLNKANGHTPNTLVSLPQLNNFLPNQNSNPQLTTGMTADAEELGNYAWMVFADGDYYITGEKDGYVTFDSRLDSKTNSSLGDSWIKNGVIHIGETLMRYNIVMDAIIPDPTIQIDSPDHDAYLKDQSPTITGTTNVKDGSSVQVKIGGNTYTGTVENNKWSVTVTDKLSDGHYTATAAVNSATDDVTFSIDTTKPTLVLKGDEKVNVTANDVYQDAGAEATDLIDGDITSRIQVSGIPEDTKTPGKFTITYTVKDKAGNEADPVTRVLIVKPDKLTAAGSSNGENTIKISNATPGALITIYDSKGEVVVSGTANSEGTITFTDIPAGSGYKATQIVNDVESSFSNEVTIVTPVVEGNNGTEEQPGTGTVSQPGGTVESPADGTSNQPATPVEEPADGTSNQPAT
ncbi:DUF5011 domain-containing protein, partial [Bacillus sp. ISL-18]|uniref:Ig-like domain-containing protein n=1 Tax=Bacillus sp. ISL-18 TaxID=2819118 RepID=UPI001BE55D1D